MIFLSIRIDLERMKGEEREEKEEGKCFGYYLITYTLG